MSISTGATSTARRCCNCPFLSESEASVRVPPKDHDRDTVERRLDAVERALTDEEPIERDDRLAELETRIAELEAAVQALRGYIGSVRAVNEEIEQRADRALRTAEAVERHVAPGEVDDADDGGDGRDGTSPLVRLRNRL